jgi:hypothetical protein
MQHMLSKKFSFREIWNMLLLVCLVLGFSSAANAASEQQRSLQFDLNCSFVDVACHWKQMNLRLGKLNRSVSVYNHRPHNQTEASACSSVTSLSLSSDPVDGRVQIATQDKCQESEIPVSMALWLSALALVGFVSTSTKRSI